MKSYMTVLNGTFVVLIIRQVNGYFYFKQEGDRVYEALPPVLKTFQHAVNEIRAVHHYTFLGECTHDGT